VFKIVQSSANHKQIVLRNSVSGHYTVWADVDMLVSILNNLMSNAIKFSQPNSEIVVFAHKKGAFVEVSVQDTGIGIEEKYLDQLFYAVHKGLGTQNEKGTGMGLILTREFIEKNGGKIWVNSTLGEGTCFTFSLPIRSPARTLPE
jgi:signal transduction histidine kinase